MYMERDTFDPKRAYTTENPFFSSERTRVDYKAMYLPNLHNKQKKRKDGEKQARVDKNVTIWTQTACSALNWKEERAGKRRKKRKVQHIGGKERSQRR